MEFKDRNQDLFLDEKSLIELPALIWSILIICCLLLAFSLLFFECYIVLFLFLGFCLTIAIFFNLYIGILIFLAGAYLHPTTFFPVLQQFHIARNLAFGVLFIWIFHTVIYRDFSIVKAPQNLIIIAFSILFFSSSLREFNYSFPIFLELMSKAVILYFAVANIVKSRRQSIILIGTVIILGAISASVGLYQYTHHIGLRISSGVRIFGTTENPNILASELVFLVPLLICLFVNQKKIMVKGLIVLIAFLVMVAIVLTFSRAGAIVLLFVLFFSIKNFVFKKQRISLAVLYTLSVMIVGMLLILPFLPEQYLERLQTITNLEEISVRSRLEAWKIASEITIENPFLGAGPGLFPFEFGLKALSSPEIKTRFMLLHAHNLYLNVSAECGILASLLLILLIYFSWKHLNVARVQFKEKGDFLLSDVSGALAISLIAFALLNMLTSHLQLLIFWIIIGFSVALRELSRNE